MCNCVFYVNALSFRVADAVPDYVADKIPGALKIPGFSKNENESTTAEQSTTTTSTTAATDTEKNSANFGDKIHTVINATIGGIMKIPDVIPSPEDMFQSAKNLIAGYPADLAARAINTFCKC